MRALSFAGAAAGLLLAGACSVAPDPPSVTWTGATVGFDATLTERGLRASAPLAELRLTFAGWARTTWAPPGAASMTPRGELTWADGVTEWYRPRPAGGLEHGFTLAKRPRGAGPLRLGMAVGMLRPVPRNPQWIDLVDDGGHARWSYRHCIVRDAVEASVPCTLGVEGHRVVLIIEDAQATYPLTVDPELFVPVTTVPPNVIDDVNFGTQVTVDAGTLAVGREEGVEVFVGGPTTWTHQQTLSIPSLGIFGGEALALDGDLLVVGADDEGATGAVFTFTRNAAVWTAGQLLTPPGGVTGDNFGFDLALDADWLAVGMPFSDDFAVQAGAVIVFSRSGDTFAFDEILYEAVPEFTGRFGQAVAFDGPRLVVAAQGANTSNGRLLTFEHDGSSWQQVDAYDAPGIDNGFGRSIAADQGRLVVGVDEKPEVQFFDWDDVNTTWTLVTSDLPPGATVGGAFATEVAIEGDLAVVSEEDEGAGRVVVYRRGMGTWSRGESIQSPDPVLFRSFGTSVALEGGFAYAGEYSFQVGNTLSGAVHVFAVSGVPCLGAGECGTGQCVDGFCCDQPCDGACDRCDVSGSEGQCTIVPGDLGTPSCSPYLCDTDPACPTSCSDANECVGGHFCDGTCIPQFANGTECDQDFQCQSGICTDGVCCDRACEGSCEACAELGTEGTCTFVTGSPRPNHPPCDDARCEVAERTAAATCDGTSADCAAGEVSPCNPYACGTDAACRETCTDPSHCSGDAVCDFETNLCAAPPPDVRCEGSDLILSDGAVTACAPYRCAEQTCLTSCLSSADCAGGFACDSSGRCVTPPQTVVIEGGCSVAPSPQGHTPGWWWLALLGAGRGRSPARRRRPRGRPGRHRGRGAETSAPGRIAGAGERGGGAAVGGRHGPVVRHDVASAGDVDADRAVEDHRLDGG